MNITAGQENRPQAASENLVIQEMEDEILIYNLQTHRAMNLNKTAACVWNLCNGKNTLSEIHARASNQLQASVSQDLLMLTLLELNSHSLLIENQQTDSIENLPDFSRRALIRRAALTTVAALPVITALTAPTSAAAQSVQNGLPDGQPCQADADCTSTCCFDAVCSPIDACFA